MIRKFVRFGRSGVYLRQPRTALSVRLPRRSERENNGALILAAFFQASEKAFRSVETNPCVPLLVTREISFSNARKLALELLL